MGAAGFGPQNIVSTKMNSYDLEFHKKKEPTVSIFKEIYVHEGTVNFCLHYIDSEPIRLKEHH